MSQPISAEIDIEGEPTLYAGRLRMASINLTNRTDTPITLPATAGPASAADHQLVVSLPADTLSPVSLQQITGLDGWSLTTGERRDGPNAWHSLYLTRGAEQTISPGKTLSIPVRGIAAEAHGSARYTRAVIDYRIVDNGHILTDSRSSVLHVLPWPHNPAHLHLAAGVRGDSVVINTAAIQNRLQVVLTASAVLGHVELVGGQTEIDLAWDVGPAESRWWSLCTPAEANSTRLHVSGLYRPLAPGHFEPVGDELVFDPWVSPTSASASFVMPDSVRLAEGESISLTIENLYTQHPSGPANLYLSVRGAEGGLSGHWVMQIEKFPHKLDNRGGVTLYTDGMPSFEIRDRKDRPKFWVLDLGDQTRLEVIGELPGQPEYDDVGASIGSDGRAGFKTAVEVGRDNDIVELSADHGLKLSRPATTGGLIFGPPTDDITYRVSTDSGYVRFHTAVNLQGTVDADRDLSVGGSLTVRGTLTTVNTLDVRTRLKTPQVDIGNRTSFTDAGLRIDGYHPIEVQTTTVRPDTNNPTGRDDRWTILAFQPHTMATSWQFSISGVGFALSANVPLRIVMQGGQWHVELDPNAPFLVSAAGDAYNAHITLRQLARLPNVGKPGGQTQVRMVWARTEIAQS